MAEKDRDEGPTLDELVAWLDAHPANREGADKTFVLEFLERRLRLVRNARVLPGEGPDAGLR